MVDNVYFSKLKRIYTDGNSIFFINGRSSNFVILGIVAIVGLYLVLVINSQFFLANVIAIFSIIFFLQSVCTYSVSWIDRNTLLFDWRKKILGVSIRRKSGELSKDFHFHIYQITEYDSGNAYAVDLCSNEIELRLFDLEKRKNLDKVLSFFHVNNMTYLKDEDL